MAKLPSGRCILGWDKSSVQLAPVERHTVYRIWRFLDQDEIRSGLYVHSKQGQRARLVYVGATTTPRTRLLAHLRDGKPGDFVELEFFRYAGHMAAAEAAAHASESPEIICQPTQRHGTWRARKPRPAITEEEAYMACTLGPPTKHVCTSECDPASHDGQAV